jgi:hypothetical protein
MRPLSTVVSPSMPLLMLGSSSGSGAVGLGLLAVEITVSVGKTVVVDIDTLPWRASPLT